MDTVLRKKKKLQRLIRWRDKELKEKFKTTHIIIIIIIIIKIIITIYYVYYVFFIFFYWSYILRQLCSSWGLYTWMNLQRDVSWLNKKLYNVHVMHWLDSPIHISNFNKLLFSQTKWEPVRGIRCKGIGSSSQIMLLYSSKAKLPKGRAQCHRTD